MTTASDSPSARTNAAVSSAEARQVVAARRVVAAAVATQVGGDDAVAGGREAAQLVAPGPPELREPVQEQDEWTAARLGDVVAGAVGRDRAMGPRPGKGDDWVSDRHWGCWTPG